MKDIYIVNCCRTAVGSFGGSLKDVSAVEMGSIVVKEALKRSGVAPENVDEVIFGGVLTAGLVRGQDLMKACKAAVEYTYACIDRTFREYPYMTYGVDFESDLYKMREITVP